MEELPFGVGDTLETVSLSPCVGGIVQTCSEAGELKIWSVPQAARLLSLQATGYLGRSLRDQQD